MQVNNRRLFELLCCAALGAAMRCPQNKERQKLVFGREYVFCDIPWKCLVSIFVHMGPSLKNSEVTKQMAERQNGRTHALLPGRGYERFYARKRSFANKQIRQ